MKKNVPTQRKIVSLKIAFRVNGILYDIYFLIYRVVSVYVTNQIKD